MTEATPPLARTHPALGDLQHEIATTRRVLERLSDEHLPWRPHPRSWTAGELAVHLGNLLSWGIGILDAPEFDLAAPIPRAEVPQRSEEVLARFDAGAERLLAGLAAATPEAMREVWTLRRGEQVLMALPRAAAIRSMIISHSIHHRGQLGVYLRLLGVPVPPIYGPSADEPR